MTTGAERDNQFSDADQKMEDTFTGKPVDVRKAAKFSPGTDVETRQDSTKND